MKLKTRLKLAWLEVAVAGAILVGGVGLRLATSSARTTVGLALDLALPALLLLPLCVGAWMRLRKLVVDIGVQGPEASPPADLWSAPGAPGIVGAMILLLALAAALAPPLLFR